MKQKNTVQWRTPGVVGLAAGAAVGVSGTLVAWWIPRGPITTAQALISMVVALAVGAAAGRLTKTRWSMLLAPVAFTAAFEIARMSVDGPTVDAVNLSSVYGFIAFLLGRVVPAVLILAPMSFGAALGVWSANRLSGGARKRNRVAHVVMIAAATGLLAIALVVARPAVTEPILGSDGGTLPGSVAELVDVSIGDTEQTMMIRGRSADAPVILYLAGGPGGTDLGAMRDDVSLEQDFVVVTWEQRGVGKSYKALDPVSTMTLEQAIADTVEVTEYLRERFGEEKIYLVGDSWGALLGTLVVQQRPELFHAYVGCGQMVSPRQTDIMMYEETVAWAQSTGNSDLVAQLDKNGPPPYDVLASYEAALSYEHDWNPYPDLDVSKEMPGNVFVPENNFMDRVNALRSFLDTFSVLYPQLQDVDFRRDVAKLEVPVCLVIGRHEVAGRAVPAREWFELLEAPDKEYVVFERSGHRPLFEEPVRFASLMNRIARETYPGRTKTAADRTR